MKKREVEVEEEKLCMQGETFAEKNAFSFTFDNKNRDDDDGNIKCSRQC